MIIVGVRSIVAGAAFGIDVAVKNRFPVSDLEVFGSTLGFHHAEEIFLLGAVTGAAILLGLALLTARTVRRRSRNGADRRQPSRLAENDQRAAIASRTRGRGQWSRSLATPGEVVLGPSAVDSTKAVQEKAGLSPAVGGSTPRQGV